MNGEDAQASDIPISSNVAACSEVCRAVGILESLVTGDAVDGEISIEVNSSVKVTGTSAKLLESAPGETFRAVGSVLKKFVLPLRAANTALEYGEIARQCDIECSRNPLD